MSNQPVPSALKVFVVSLVAGAGGGYLAFRLGILLVHRFIHDDLLAFVVTALLTGLVAIASAVTAGVVIGRATKSP